MTDHANRDIAERLWNAIALADADELRGVIAPKAVWRMYGRSPLAGIYKGIDAILGFMAHTGELADELESSLLEVFTSGEGAVLRYSVRARREERVLNTEHLFMIRIAEGRIVEGVFAPVDQDRYDRFWLGLPDLSSEEQGHGQVRDAPATEKLRLVRTPAKV
jgi:ketosteroid isomerase-like protein